LLIDPISDHGTLRGGPQRGAARLAYEAEFFSALTLISSKIFASGPVPAHAPHPLHVLLLCYRIDQHTDRSRAKGEKEKES
jgi:hypothetical protein